MYDLYLLFIKRISFRWLILSAVSSIVFAQVFWWLGLVGPALFVGLWVPSLILFAIIKKIEAIEESLEKLNEQKADKAKETKGNERGIN